MMKIEPSTAEAKLGFDVVERHLGGYMLSSLGKDWLQQTEASHSLDIVRDELERVAELQQMLRERQALPLEGHIDIRGILRRVAPEGAYVDPGDLLAVGTAAATMRYLKKAFTAEKCPRMAHMMGLIVVLRDMEEHIDHVVDSNGEVRDNASRELRRVRRALRLKRVSVRVRIQEELQKAHSQGFASEMQPTMRGGRMVIPLRAEAKRKIKGFVHDTSASGQTVYVEPAACLELNNEVRLLEAEERREVERILREVTGHVRTCMEELDSNLRYMAHFDVLQAKARLAQEMDAVVPHLQCEAGIDIREGRNPLLLLHQAGHAVVPLDLTLGEEAVTLVITGPNAGGKTVAMKTVGLFALMLAHGMPIPVHPESRCCLFQYIRVEIGDEQSIEEDLSTFSSRVRGFQRMLECADSHTLMLIDEIGTGTDPSEGAALAQAVLESLTRSDALTIVTTHHGTLKAYAHEAEGVENGSMEFDQETFRPTYRFRQHLPGSSYAFRIAERMEFDHEVLKRARLLMGSQEVALEELIAMFEAKNQLLDERLKGIERRGAQQQRRVKKMLVAKEKESDTTPSKKSAPAKHVRRQTTFHKRPGKQPVLHVGDRVFFDASSEIGEILEIDGTEVVVAFGSMRMHVDRIRLRKADKTSKQGVCRSPKLVDDLHTSVDLRGYRVDEAVRAVEGFIDKAVVANLLAVDILHGKGTGALREAIHTYLAAADKVDSYQTASPQHGGAGVTHVHLSA